VCRLFNELFSPKFEDKGLSINFQTEMKTPKMFPQKMFPKKFPKKFPKWAPGEQHPADLDRLAGDPHAGGVQLVQGLEGGVDMRAALLLAALSEMAHEWIC
jgi:hypothetical protein